MASEEAPPSWSLVTRIRGTEANSNGLTNAISTTKYSLLSWLPKSLWEQFRRIANVYFLVISILMLIGTYATYIFLSPLNPFSTIGTLGFVLLITSFKEGHEDYQRFKSDKTENQRKVTVCTFDSDGVMTEKVVETKDVKAGDIIKMSGTTPVPVDMLLILTSLHEDGNQCYIETANIDGETNLKLKEAPAAIKPLIKNGMPTADLFQGSLEFEPPNKSIYTFIGALKLDALENPIALSAENVLLRSSLFSNTEWGYGIAIYTGQETKIQMNNRQAGSKMSKIEEYANKAIIIVFLAQISIVSISVGSIYMMGFDSYASKLPYVYPPGHTASTSILPLWAELWFVFFLLFNNFIPISLYVTLELVNVGQASLIAGDIKMYDEALDLPATVRSSNLVQELGQVSNIFSDKTGTLTRNEMRFVKFLCEGTMYDVESVEGTNLTPSLQIIPGQLGQNKGSTLYNFLQCLATCHTVVREKDGTFRAESPDELALVNGAAKLECSLLERGTSQMTISMEGTKKTFDVLGVNAFNSDRKRMSLLVRDVESNEYYCMCKGADNIMLPLCALDPKKKKGIEKSLLDLACMGLRTLCIAQKKLDKGAALDWLKKWKEASSSLTNRADKLVAVAAELEVEMQLLGVTAIEDRLQDEVPEVIADLSKAGIIVWMLTGDKEETAINIGHSCNLLLADTKIFFITKIDDAKSYADQLRTVHDDIVNNFEPGRGYRDQQTGQVVDIALVMDGPSFKYFDDESAEQRGMFLKIGQSVRSVIACRLTPKQKEQVVHVVKVETVPKAITLSIGDGANDVSMIREADVGVGIFGKEGRQAANNADFAIGQFKFLRRLLLVHGRWNYIRQSRVFLYSLHKNMVLTLTLYWFSYFTAVSGTSPYETWIYSGFNLILGLPIIFYGILDRDLTDDFVTKYPQVYVTGKQNRYLRTSAIAMWILNAIAFATVLCLSFYYCVRPTFKEYSLYSMGTVCYTGLCNALQFKVAFMSHQWALPQVVSMIISVGGMLAAYVVFSNASGDYYGVSTYLFNTPMFWFFGFFSVPLFAGLIDVVAHNLSFFFRPSEEMLFREVDLQRYVLPLSHETLACPPKHSRAHFPSLTTPESILHPLPLFPSSLKPSKPLSNPSKSNLNNHRAYTNDPLASAKLVGLSNADADDGIEMGGWSQRRF